MNSVIVMYLLYYTERDMMLRTMVGDTSVMIVTLLTIGLSSRQS